MLRNTDILCHCQKADNRAEMMAKIERLAAALDVDFWVFDDLEMANEQSNFFSTLNTTIKGSEIFTDTLGRYFNAYKLEK